MKPTMTVMKVGKYLFSGPYTHTGVQRLIQWIMDSQGIGQFELSKRSGLSPATIFQILNKSEGQVTRPPRRSTLSALGQAIGADLQFDGEKNQFALVQKYELPKTEARELSLLLSEIGNWIMSRRKALTKEERERIVRVVKALIG
jgi:transcriptional regulator with XRE-family HTH domain